MKAGPGGLPAGEIARRLAVLPNSLSANLHVLADAGLVTARRTGRSIIYSAGYSTMSTLLDFLVADCCKGAPEVCAPLADVVSQAAACSAPVKVKTPGRARKTVPP